MTAGEVPRSGDEKDVLNYVSGSLSDALGAVDAARAAIGTSLVWVRIAQARHDDPNGESTTD